MQGNKRFTEKRAKFYINTHRERLGISRNDGIRLLGVRLIAHLFAMDLHTFYVEVLHEQCCPNSYHSTSHSSSSSGSGSPSKQSFRSSPDQNCLTHPDYEFRTSSRFLLAVGAVLRSALRRNVQSVTKSV